LDTEFGCYDGDCISLADRCDGASECNDKEDELNCEMVVIDKKLYHKGIPPLRTDDQLTNVTVNMTVLSLSNINEIEMTFTAKFYIHLDW